MFCVHCGAAVSEGANFCGGCGRPVSAGDASPLASIKGALTFRNVRIMNIVGAAGMALLGVVVILSMFGKVSALVLAIFSSVLAVMLAAPVVSALALSQTAGKAVRWIAVGLNVALILLWVLSVVQGLLHPSSQILFSLASAVFYVVPQVVNIRALRAIGSNTSMQQA